MGVNMSITITSSKEFAKKLSDHTVRTAMSRKELKALAKMIDYPIGIFHKEERKKLADKLLCLYALLGSLAIKICYKSHPEIDQYIPETIIENYKIYLCEQLTKQEVSLLTKI